MGRGPGKDRTIGPGMRNPNVDSITSAAQCALVPSLCIFVVIVFVVDGVRFLSSRALLQQRLFVVARRHLQHSEMLC
jgi:hypothetical protein